MTVSLVRVDDFAQPPGGGPQGYTDLNADVGQAYMYVAYTLYRDGTGSSGGQNVTSSGWTEMTDTGGGPYVVDGDDWYISARFRTTPTASTPTITLPGGDEAHTYVLVLETDAPLDVQFDAP